MRAKNSCLQGFDYTLKCIMTNPKYLLALTTAAVLTACGGGGGSAPSAGFPAMAPVATSTSPAEVAPAPVAPPAAVCTVALYGDSILYGGYFPNGRLLSPPAAVLRAELPKFTVLDLSAVGDSAYAHQVAFLNDPLGSRFVVLQYGVNDAGSHFSYETPLRSMIQHAQALKATVLVTGLSRPDGGSADRNAYDLIAKRVAGEEGAQFLDWGSVQPVVTVDGLHPASPYSAALTQLIVDKLKILAPECQ